MYLYLQAKRKKKQEAANAKILEAEKRIKVRLDLNKLIESGFQSLLI